MYKLLCLANAFLLFISCSKSDSPILNPPPPPTPPPPPIVVDSAAGKKGWSKIQITNTILTDVTWIDTNRLAIIAPANSQIFSSADGGIHWSPLSPYAYGVNITSSPNGRLFWTVGQPDITWINRYRNGVADSSNLSKSAYDMVVLDDSTGYASLSSSPGLAQTHNGGDTWELAATGMTNIVASNYSTLFFLNSNQGLASFDSKVYYTNQGISNWHKSTINITVSNIVCSKLQLVSPNLAYAGFTDGSLFRSIDSGKTFMKIPLPLTLAQKFLDFQFLDANNGYLCYDKVILQSIDGGNKWDTVVYDNRRQFIELEFLDASHGAAVTDSGSVFIYRK